MKGIRSVKHIAVFTIFVMLISMFSWVSANTALAIESPVITPDFDTNEYVFDISISGYSEYVNANIILASYDEDYTTIDKVIEPATSPLAKLRLPSGKGEKSYKIMLIDPVNLKPLCSSFGGEFSNYDIVTVISDDIAEVILTSSGYNVEYYTSPTSSRIARIKLSSDVRVEYNKEECYQRIEDILQNYDMEINFVDINSDDVYDKVQAFEYTYVRIANITEEYIRFESGDLYEFDSVLTTFEDSDGNEIDWYDFEAGESVAVIIGLTGNKCFEIAKLSSVSGMIESMYTRGNLQYVSIGGTEYAVDGNIVLSLGDEGVFYLGMTGKIVDYEALEEDINYAYVLEFQFDTSSFEDTLYIRLLTEDGVKIYSVTEKRIEEIQQYFSDNYYAYTIDGDASFFRDATDSEKSNSARVVSYNLNGRGEITGIELASDRNSLVVDSAVYNAGTNQVGGYTVFDDALVYDLTADKANDTTTYNISSLKRDYQYQAAIVYDLDGERRFVIITKKEIYVSAKSCMAIVTHTAVSMNSDGEEVTEITYLSDGMEYEIDFNEDSIRKGTVDYSELNVGDVFMFVSGDDDNVVEYTVLAQIDDNKSGFTNVAENSLLGNDVEIKTGYIANTRMISGGGGEIITIGTGEYICDISGNYYIGGEDILVPRSCNSYSYDNEARRPEVSFNPFTPEYAYVDVDAQIALVTPILLLIKDNEVKESYFFWTPCEIPVSVQ